MQSLAKRASRPSEGEVGLWVREGMREGREEMEEVSQSRGRSMMFERSVL